jgi:hypothetical protein
MAMAQVVPPPPPRYFFLVLIITPPLLSTHHSSMRCANSLTIQHITVRSVVRISFLARHMAGFGVKIVSIANLKLRVEHM